MLDGKKAILWAEDDPYYKGHITPMLECAGFRVLDAGNAKVAMDIILSRNREVDLVLLDVAMPDGGAFDDIKTKSGHQTGLLLANWIRDKYPSIPIVGFSVNWSASTERWFVELGDGYFRKGAQDWTLVEHLKRKLGIGGMRANTPRIFIVHGHDETAIDDLKSLLSKKLGFKDIVVLREMPGQGRTIIEKFEQTVETIDVVFVLLTPDDVGFARKAPKEKYKRARQNVVFELGYFFAKLQRTRGSVIVLSKGKVEKPSDIAGIEYIDITKGMSSASKKIKQELGAWLS